MNLWFLRRLVLLVCVLLLLIAIMMFLDIQVAETHGGSVELLNGQANASALAWPLVLFLVGAAGLFAVLNWHPDRR
jgi:hypothetical protein